MFKLLKQNGEDVIITMSSSLLSGYGRYLVVKRLQPPHSRHSSTLPRRPLSELRRATELDVPVASLPERAKVVVCGGGAQGAAIAYALAKRGLAEETVLIDKVRNPSLGDLSGVHW